MHARVAPAAEGAAAAANAEAEGEVEDGGADGERWMSGAELEGFTGDWMALARKRTGRTASGISAAAADAAAGKGGRRGAGSARDTSPVAHRPTLALQSNVRKQNQRDELRRGPFSGCPPVGRRQPPARPGPVARGFLWELFGS